MRILVCIKQVPEQHCHIAVSASGKVAPDPGCGFCMNRFDTFAIQEAVNIGKQTPGTVVDAITVGPDRAADVMKRAMGMGADHGIHIVTDPGYEPGPEATAAAVASVARGRDYSLVLAGIMSADLNQGLVGPFVAAALGLACVTSVKKLEIERDGASAYVEREIEGGRRDCLRVGLPAVITVQAGINTPGYPSLSNVLRANKIGVERIPISDLDIGDTRRSRVVGAAYPQRQRAALMLNGNTEQKAEQLRALLRGKHLI